MYLNNEVIQSWFVDWLSSLRSFCYNELFK